MTYTNWKHGNPPVSSGSALSVQSIQYNTAYAGPAAHSEGLTYWDANAGTLAVMTDIDNVTIQVGEEVQIKVHNETGSIIPNGTPVYVSSVDAGGNLDVTPAKADAFTTSLVIGLATEDIGIGANGRVTKVGIVRDIDTSGLSTGTVYLSSTVAGGLVNAEPQPPSISVQIGQVLVSDAAVGQILVDLDRASNTPQTITFTMPLRGTTASTLYLTGELRDVTTGETGDYATDFPVSNNHIYLLVNTITGTGDVTITGTSLSESSAVPVSGDTEVISVDASAAQYYQSSKKWWEITNIDIPAGIAAINYDVGVVGYSDINNQNFELLAYRLDMTAQGNNPDLRFRILKVQDDGGGKMSLVELEDIGVDADGAGDQVIDGLRTGGDDRSYNPAVGSIWLDTTVFVFKQGDFATYFTSDENVINSGTSNSGIILEFTGSPSGGMTNVDFASLQLRYRPL
jgi:hypothetical protein